MKKLFYALLLSVAFTGSAFAAGTVLEIKYADIRKFMAQSGKYENLMERMEAGDQSLSLKDYAYLYYGFSFTDGYVFGTPTATESAVYELTENEQYDEAWAMCTDYLTHNPFSMFALNLGVFLTDYRRDFETSRKYYTRSARILEVIEASGDGSPARPYQVISEGDINYYLTYQVSAYDFMEVELPQKDGRMAYQVETEGELNTVYFAFDLCRK